MICLFVGVHFVTLAAGSCFDYNSETATTYTSFGLSVVFFMHMHRFLLILCCLATGGCFDHSSTFVLFFGLLHA